MNLWLIPIGFLVGAFGTLIGAGGGFVLVPVLLLMYPEESPEIITSISLAVVFFNALSGSIAYARLKRIDYRTGIMFAAVTVPTAILGVYTVDHVPRRMFNALFGVLLLFFSLYLLFVRQERKNGGSASSQKEKGITCRSFRDRSGEEHCYCFSMKKGMVLSFFVGYISSLLGIGGGIIHVPAMVRMLNFPTHVATATSHMVLAVMAFAGTATHVLNGAFTTGTRRTALLAAGVLVGAQLGAALSHRLHGLTIIRCLAVALGFVGIRILLLTL